jgi:hypothetical protein
MARPKHIDGLQAARLANEAAQREPVRTLPSARPARTTRSRGVARERLDGRQRMRCVRRAWGGAPKVRRKLRRIRSRSPNPVSRAISSIGSRPCSSMNLAASRRRFSIAFAGERPDTGSVFRKPIGTPAQTYSCPAAVAIGRATTALKSRYRTGARFSVCWRIRPMAGSGRTRKQSPVAAG